MRTCAVVWLSVGLAHKIGQVLDYPKTIYHVMLMIAIVQTGYCVVRLAVFKIIGLGRVYAARRHAARRRQLPESPIQEVMMPYAFP